MASILKKAYEIMLLSRILDEFCQNEFVYKGVNLRHYHSGIGQEALSVAGAIVLRKTDYLFYTHRGVASLLAKGIPLEKVMRDLFFKTGGTNEGCGSVMHACDPEIGIVGRNGVFGSRFTIASGLALASKTRKTKNVTVCYYGEAAGARGQYYEAMNMAVLWSLPIVFIAENNGFSVNSRTDEIYATGDLSSMWKGFDIPVIKFDGNDLKACMEAVEYAVARARDGKGPSILEGVTYRISEHIPFEDHLAYRELEEIQGWAEKDPIKRAKDYLIKDGLLSEEEDKKLYDKIYTEVRNIYKEIEKAPIVDKEEVFKLVYYNDYN
jgi:TPP-dependent pyruvate/acetoin dehydrogenase alpha subunit